MKRLVIMLMCLVYIFVLITIIPQNPLKKKSVFQKEDLELSCMEFINKDSVLSYVYYESTPDSLQVRICLTHTIVGLTTMEFLNDSIFKDRFGKLQDSICNRHLNVRIDHVGIHKSYFYER